MRKKTKTQAMETIDAKRQQITERINQLERAYRNPRPSTNFEKIECKIRMLQNYEEELDDAALFVDSLGSNRTVYVLGYEEGLQVDEAWKIRPQVDGVDVKTALVSSGYLDDGAIWLKTVKKVESEAI